MRRAILSSSMVILFILGSFSPLVDIRRTEHSAPFESTQEEMEIEFREGLKRLTLKLKEQEETNSPDKLSEVASISDLKRFVSRKKNKINKL